MCKIYIIEYCDDLQQKIDVANRAALEKMTEERQGVWQKWRGPLLFENVEPADRKTWIGAFKAAGGTVTEAPRKYSLTKLQRCDAIPLNLKKLEYDGKYAYEDSRSWRTVFLSLFSHLAFAPTWRDYFTKIQPAPGSRYELQDLLLSCIPDFISTLDWKLDETEHKKLQEVREAIAAYGSDAGDLSLYPLGIAKERGQTAYHATYLASRKGSGGGNPVWTFYDRAQHWGKQGGYDIYGRGYIKRSSQLDRHRDDVGRKPSQPRMAASLKQFDKSKAITYEELNSAFGEDVTLVDECPLQRGQHINAINCPWASLESFLLHQLGRKLFDQFKLNFRAYALTKYQLCIEAEKRKIETLYNEGEEKAKEPEHQDEFYFFIEAIRKDGGDSSALGEYRAHFGTNEAIAKHYRNKAQEKVGELQGLREDHETFMNVAQPMIARASQKHQALQGSTQDLKWDGGEQIKALEAAIKEFESDGE